MNTKELCDKLATTPLAIDSMRALADEVGLGLKTESPDDTFKIAEVAASRMMAIGNQSVAQALAMLLLVAGCQIGVGVANELLRQRRH